VTYETVLRNALTQNPAPWYTLGALGALWAAGERTGVDPVVLAAQCARETGWGRFGGKGGVNASFNNTCGLKTRAGGDDDDPNAHARFVDLHTGAQAHACHLLAYASTGPLPTWNPDPRSDWVLRGIAPNVHQLGPWAPSDPKYGVELVRLVRLLRRPA
jgi:hypothetical protein